MCYHLPIETLIIAFFASKNPPTSLPLKLLQDTAKNIIRKCEYGIMIDMDYDAVYQAVSRNRDFLNFSNYLIEKFSNEFDETLFMKNNIFRKSVPDFVRVPMDEAVSSATQSKIK